MHADLVRHPHETHRVPSPRPDQRGPWARLLTALLTLAGPHAEFRQHTERPWASVTFSGTRHTVTLAFDGIDAVERGEAYAAALPDHEFAIPGYIVADAAVIALEHSQLGSPGLVVEAELLLLEDA